MVAIKPAGIPFTIAVDFDGVVCEYDFPRCGPPRQDVINLLRRLKAKGWQIVIQSSRVNTHWEKQDRLVKIAHMMTFLAVHKVPWDSVWGLQFPLGGNSPCMTNHEDVGKPVAHVYLDDRAVNPTKFTDLDRSTERLLAICLGIAESAEQGYRKGLGT